LRGTVEGWWVSPNLVFVLLVRLASGASHRPNPAVRVRFRAPSEGVPFDLAGETCNVIQAGLSALGDVPILDGGALVARTLLLGMPIQVAEKIADMEYSFALARAGFPQIYNADVRSGSAPGCKHGVQVRVPQSGVTAHLAIWWNRRVAIRIISVLRFIDRSPKC